MLAAAMEDTWERGFEESRLSGQGMFDAGWTEEAVGSLLNYAPRHRPPLPRRLLESLPPDFFRFFPLRAPLYRLSVAKFPRSRYAFPEVMDVFTIDKKNFGVFVAQLRREKGLTQRELAQALCVSDKAVSKWETGSSIPDTALLIPLAELLGVTVTELLLCRRQEEAMSPETVETVVQAAIAYPGGKPRRVWGCCGRWPLWYGLSLLLGGGGLLLCRSLQGPTGAAVTTPVLLGAVFGAWFCFFALRELPRFYDENSIHGMMDGPFRMNVPGLRFSNRNWPHILTVGRVWSCAVTAGMPALCLALWALRPDLWPRLELPLTLAVTLGGLFLPLYLVGKRFE